MRAVVLCSRYILATTLLVACAPGGPAVGPDGEASPAAVRPTGQQFPPPLLAEVWRECRDLQQLDATISQAGSFPALTAQLHDLLGRCRSLLGGNVLQPGSLDNPLANLYNDIITFRTRLAQGQSGQGAQPSQQRPVQVCVVDAAGRLAVITAQYDPTNGDTLYPGQAVSNAYPATTGYAAATTWYTNNERITFANRRWVKYGLPRILDIGEVERGGNYQGVSVFFEARAAAPADVIYIPVRPGCEFQPYHYEPFATIARNDSESTGAAAPRPSLPFPRASIPEPIRASQPRGSNEISRGGIATRMPKRFRQGRSSLVTITLLSLAPDAQSVRIIVDTAQQAESGTPVFPPDTFTEILDTTTISRRMRLELKADSVDVTAFTISPHHGTAEQTIHDDIPAKWTFRVTPYKAGKQRLYIVMDLLTQDGQTHLRTITKPIDVQVNRIWGVKHWFRVNIAPILVGSILIPLLGFIGKGLLDKKKEAVAE